MYQILVAEDESLERKVLCKTLKKHFGDLCQIHEAKNGREAVEVGLVDQLGSVGDALEYLHREIEKAKNTEQ